MEYTIMPADKATFGCCCRSLSQELFDRKPPVGKRFLKDAEKGKHLVTTRDGSYGRHHLRIGRPRLGVVVAGVERLDVARDDVFRSAHVAPLIGCRRHYLTRK